MAIPRWKWLEKVGASEEAEKEKAKATPELDRVTDKVESIAPTTTVSSTTRRSSRTRGGITRGKTTTISPVAQIVDDTKKDIIKPPVTVSDEQKAKIDVRLKWADLQSGGAPSISKGTQEVTDTEVQPIKQASTIMTPDEKLHFIKSVTGHVEPGVPEQIRDLGPGATQDYFKTVSRVQMGFIPSDVGQAQLQTGVETRLKEGSLPTSIRWMKEHGTFTSDDETYTWSELKEKHPRLEIKRESGEFIIYETPIDYGAWREEQYEGMHPIAAGIRRGTATLLGGFGSFDYMRAGHTGDPTDITKQQLKLGDIIDKWEYETTHNIETGNVLGVVAGIPAVSNIVLPYAGGVVLGHVHKGIMGASNILVQKGLVYTGKTLEYGTKAVEIGIGGAAVGVAGIDVYTTYQQDQDKALTKALTYGTQFASFSRGMKTAMDVSLKTVKTGQPTITFKGGYRPGSPNLVGRGRPYSTPSLFGKGKSYTPMKSVVYTPTSPGVVAGKAKVHFASFETTPPTFKWGYKSGQPTITFKGGYRPGSLNLVGKDMPYSTPNLVGRNRLYTPRKSVVYTPTSPGVVAGKAKAHFEKWFDTKDFIYKKPTMASGDPYKIKGLNELLGKGKIKKGLLDIKPFFEITKPSGVVKIFKQTGTDIFTPTTTGKNILLVKTKSVVSPLETITLEAPTTTTVGKISFGKMPMMGFKTIKGGNILGKIWGRRLSLEMLAASESGVYTGVHPYWFGVIPALKTALEPMTVTIPKYGFDIGQISRQTPSFLTDTMIKTDTISATKNILDIASITESIQESITETIQESIQESITETIQESIQESIAKTIQKPITETITKTITKFVPGYIPVVPHSYPPPLPPSSPYVPFGYYKKKKKYLDIDGGRKRVHPVTLLKVPKINFQGINI